MDWNPISQNPQNYSNSWLLYNDLTTSPANVGMPQLYANGSKNATIPDVSGGVLWADDVNKRFYLYGGDYYNGITPNGPNLLSYDVIYNQWESFGPPNTPINTVAWGAGIGISNLGQGYIMGGWLSNNSVSGWTGDQFATSTLIKYQMDGQIWTNNTGPDSSGRAEGVMVYLPASETGILVYFGGLLTPYNNGTIVSSPMDKIYIYDIASGRWYSQTATGDIPGDRKRFCAGAAWAPDHSSYNIYLYGGLGFGSNSSGYDDVYILSLPSFQWVKWWEGSNPPNPHHSLTCNVVNSGQMLIIGGTFPLSDSICDSPPTWGTHNLDLGKQTGKMWNDYQLNITSYVVPSEIVAVVGGSSLGGATATAPANGFNNNDLSVYFQQQASVASRTPTRAIPTPSNSTIPTNTGTPPKKSKLSTGAIVGIAIGGAVFFVAFFIAGCCLIRRHRRKHHAPTNPTTYHPHPAPDYSQHPQSPNSQFSNYTPETTRYHQLQANSIPVELPNNTFDQSRDPKSLMILQSQVNDRDPAHWAQQHSESPISTSPHPSGYSPVTEVNTNTMNTMYSQGSPVPSYSSAGRSATGRRPVPQNRTYYSP